MAIFLVTLTFTIDAPDEDGAIFETEDAIRAGMDLPDYSIDDVVMISD